MRLAAALLLLLLPAAAAAQPDEPPNGILLIAKPELLDPNFRETVVLVTQAPDFSTVGVVLNHPTARKHEKSGETLYSGGPVMRQVLVALFRAESAPPAPAFQVLKGIYLSMHPENLEPLAGPGAQRHRFYTGFSGWAPRQLESEMARESWYVLPASEDVIFREDTTNLWRELLDKAQKRKTPHARALGALIYFCS
jgi:putative transcriptional regulator